MIIRSYFYANYSINIIYFLAVISPYAEYRPTSQDSSPLASVPIDDTTGENIYEEIPDVLNPTTTTECIYKNII